MKILFTKTFNKSILKLGSILKDDIIKLLEKYPNTNNLKEIDNFENSIVLKGYLLSKRVRIIILFQNVKGKFIPIYIMKKESKKGFNISKDNYIDLFGNFIDKSILDIENKDYEEVEISFYKN